MQGMHVFQPQARTAIDLEFFVEDGHFLRKIHRVLQLSFVREITASCYAVGHGRPSIDPEVYFRMLLVGYLYGITSDRRLCEEVRYNLAYRWFCRLSLEDEVPDHSSLGRIRDRFGEQIFELVFRRIVALCKEKGLVTQECHVMTDATLIAANAALNSLIHNDPREAEKEAITQGSSRGLKDSSSARRVTNQTHTSRTDPDATLAQKKGTPQQLKYKVHQSIDADSRVILDTEVTTGAKHDNQRLPWPVAADPRPVQDHHSRGNGGRGLRLGNHHQDLATGRNYDLHSALERPRWKQQVPERRVGLRQEAGSIPLSTRKVSHAEPVYCRQQQTICQFFGRLSALSTEIKLPNGISKERAV